MMDKWERLWEQVKLEYGWACESSDDSRRSGDEGRQRFDEGMKCAYRSILACMVIYEEDEDEDGFADHLN